ncbi:MAG: peptidase M28, partial [Novosphingobium sp.]|nr:peptidase M28 [Novosphingobium sp.]
MFRMTATAWLAAFLVAACATAPVSGKKTVPGIPDISVETLREVTRVLSQDDFEGRAPGTAGEERTLAYLVGRFAHAGLEPGNRGSWFQEVPLVEIAGRDHSPLSVSGKAQHLRFAHGSEYVAVTYRLSPEIALSESELVFVGYGINAPEKGWNDYAGIDMRGKTALILINDPDHAQQGLDGPFNGRAMTYYGRWTYKFEEAARQGAAAALVIHDTIPASYGWNVVESSWTGPQAHAERADQGMSQTLANGWLQKEAAERIFAAAGLDLASLSRAAGQPGFRAVLL